VRQWLSAKATVIYSAAAQVRA
jgi:hypothetical protein